MGQTGSACSVVRFGSRDLKEVASAVDSVAVTEVGQLAAEAPLVEA